MGGCWWTRGKKAMDAYQPSLRGGNCVIVKKIKRERTMLRVAHKDTDRERVNGQTGDDNGKKDVYQRIEKSEI